MNGASLGWNDLFGLERHTLLYGTYSAGLGLAQSTVHGLLRSVCKGKHPRLLALALFHEKIPYLTLP